MRLFYLIDTTLRDGEQAPGVVFSESEKIEIASILDEAGVPEVELGTPAVSGDDIAQINLLSNYGFNFRTACWSRAREDDILLALKTGVNQINISFPVSDILLRVMSKDRKWVEKEVARLIPFALQHFEYVSVGAMDASRCAWDFLESFTGLALDRGACRVRYSDTVGVMHAGYVGGFFSKMSERFPGSEFEFHGHNDLGMATANTLSALTNGCRCASVTVNGLGERAGNAALEEVVAALSGSCGIDCGIDMKKLVHLCDVVSRASGRVIHPSKPVSGSMAFSHESGIHCSGLAKDPLAFQPFHPEELGRNQTFVAGRHSGEASIKSILEKTGVSLDHHLFPRFLASVKAESVRKKRALSMEEVQRLASEF
ncbi:MAG: homocitrate synthase/isopropylmalate synthase family protein [Marinilabiliaceae bacterium]